MCPSVCLDPSLRLVAPLPHLPGASFFVKAADVTGAAAVSAGISGSPPVTIKDAALSRLASELSHNKESEATGSVCGEQIQPETAEAELHNRRLFRCCYWSLTRKVQKLYFPLISADILWLFYWTHFYNMLILQWFVLLWYSQSFPSTPPTWFRRG